MNMVRVVIVVFLMFIFSMGSKAQTWQNTDMGIKTSIANLSIDIQFYSPSIVRIIKTPIDKKFTKESLSVIKKPQKTIVRIAKEGNHLNLKSEKIQVQVNLESGAEGA